MRRKKQKNVQKAMNTPYYYCSLHTWHGNKVYVMNIHIKNDLRDKDNI